MLEVLCMNVVTKYAVLALFLSATVCIVAHAHVTTLYGKSADIASHPMWMLVHMPICNVLRILLKQSQ